MRCSSICSIFPCLLVCALLAPVVPLAEAQRPHGAGVPRAERHEFRRAVEQQEEAWRDAVLRRDVAAMANLLADDYIGITPNGTLQSKEQTLNNLRNGVLHFKFITVSDRKVRFYGKTAVVTSRAEVSGNAGDGDISGSYRYTRVYALDARGGWKIVSFEASRIRPRDGA